MAASSPLRGPSVLREGEKETSESEPLPVTLAAASAGEGPGVRGTQADLAAVKRGALLQKIEKEKNKCSKVSALVCFCDTWFFFLIFFLIPGRLGCSQRVNQLLARLRQLRRETLLALLPPHTHVCLQSGHFVPRRAFLGARSLKNKKINSPESAP